MDIILTLTYTALAIAAFKLLKIPITKWSVTTTALGGAFLLAWIYTSMAFFHPFTPSARMYYITTPISSQVRGKVVEVYVTSDKSLKKGDPLFKIDPAPYQDKVNQLKAELTLARKRVEESAALQKVEAGSLYELEQYQANVASLEAQLKKAEFDLESTTVLAPADGHVTQNRVRKGITAGIVRVSALMTFVHDEDPVFIAAFRPNGIQNIKVGAEAEVMFTAIPGKTFKAKVVKLWNEIAEGNVFAQGTRMISVTKRLPPGRIPVQIELIDDVSPYYLPKGSEGGVCVYSKHLTGLGDLRLILLHMYSWMNIFSFDEPGGE